LKTKKSKGKKTTQKKPCVHLICNAHLDPVWQWQWEEGCAEALSTFRNAAKLLREHDSLIFNHNESLLYRWIKMHDPELFEEIQNLVKDNRWSISGGWYLQPDVNLPPTESLIRHIAEGRRFFSEHFNTEPEVAYNFDSFGHSGGLPQLLAQAGYKMYIHMRPQESELELPSDLYIWRGVDGTEILGYRISTGLYHTERDNIAQRLEEGTAQAQELKRDVPVFWGLGNHGGGATREDLEKIDALIRKEKRVRITHSTPDRFYKAVKDAAQNAPVFEGDLQRVFTGCYTSLARLKRTAQQTFHKLVQAETLRAATWWAYKQDYPSDEIEDSWRDVLFNDFHDILTGTCTEPAEQDALNLYGRVSETVKRIRLEAAAVFNQDKKQDFSIPVTVMNSNPGITIAPVEVECMISPRPLKGPWHLKLFKPDGTEIPCQEQQPEALLPFNRWRRRITFMADLPCVGAVNYQLKAFEGEPESGVENPALHFEIGKKTGLVVRLVPGKGDSCLAAPLMRPLVIEDKGDSWGTDCWTYRKTVGEFKVDPQSMRVLEQGHIRSTYESIFHHNLSKIVMHTTAYTHWPALEYRLRIHWNEERKLLKLSIPTIYKNEFLTCEVPGGIIKRTADGEEEVFGRWFLLRGEGSESRTALGVAANGQHGLDFKDGEVRLSVLRSPAYCHEKGFKLADYPYRKFMDQGVHDIRLLVIAGDAASIRLLLSALADWLNAPPVAYAHLPAGLIDPEGVEILSVEPENIRLIACKPSWDGRSLIIRLQESSGMATPALLQIKDVKAIINLSFKPMEIKTLRIERSGKWKEVKMIEET
jgi:alpha-mannosidase